MPIAPTEDYRITPELMKFALDWKTKPGNLIMILHRTQQEYGFVPRSIAVELSEVLEVPLAKIYGVITFYHYFKLKKPGRNRISVCLGTACYLKGAGGLMSELEDLLGIAPNAVTDDGEFSYEAVRCVGCCGLAPVLTVNGDVYGKIGKDGIPDVLAKYRNVPKK